MNRNQKRFVTDLSLILRSKVKSKDMRDLIDNQSDGDEPNTLQCIISAFKNLMRRMDIEFSFEKNLSNPFIKQLPRRVFQYEE
jgi:hypothetical protein